MTKEEAIAHIKAAMAFARKPRPQFDTPEFDDYMIEQFTINRRGMRVAKEYPNLTFGTNDPSAQPMPFPDVPPSPSK